MKKNYLKTMALAFLAATSITFVACDDDDEKDDNTADLSGVIQSGETVTLERGKTYTLSGGYTVKSGGILRVEPGVTIEAVADDDVDYILVEQGGQIFAEGTADAPIIMTSQRKQSGGWGGLHICGRAHTNRGAGAMSEIGNAPYGGSIDDDNSGTLRYIRLEYTGYAFDEEHESNGVSFYGVGSGTTVEYLQSYKGADDGFEFFGGSVNVKYLVVTDNEDDSFDWTEGWDGNAQFLIADQRGTSGAKDQGDCLIEADNNADNFEQTPVSFPTLANLTLIGNNSTEGSRGIRLRAGTKANIYNAIIVGKPNCLTTETHQTESSLASGESKLMNITLASTIRCDGQEPTDDNPDAPKFDPAYSEEAFLAPANHNAINSTFTFSAGSWTGTLASDFNPSSLGTFFTSAAYQGALPSGSDWTSGWTLK